MGPIEPSKMEIFAIDASCKFNFLHGKMLNNTWRSLKFDAVKWNACHNGNALCQALQSKKKNPSLMLITIWNRLLLLRVIPTRGGWFSFSSFMDSVDDYRYRRKLHKVTGKCPFYDNPFYLLPLAKIFHPMWGWPLRGVCISAQNCCIKQMWRFRSSRSEW